MGSRGGKNQQAEVPTYFMSSHEGLCHWGPGIVLLTVYAGEKLVRSLFVNNVEKHNINRPNLFGGMKKEGGMKGDMWVLPGAEDQVLPANLAYRYNRTPATCPAYRGIFSVFFTGEDQVTIPNDPVTGNPDYLNSTYSPGTTSGFYLAAVNPYIKQKKYRIRRPSKGAGLNSSFEYIDLGIEKDDRPIFASNPAHVLYELKVNRTWGEGRDPSTIDIASFNTAAETLFNEDFGISFTWLRQSTIDTVASEIIDHIQAAMYDDPETGLLTLKLLRNDYSVGTLPLLTPDNAFLTHFKRKLWGEVTGEVTVTWTNPLNEEEETVTAHNLSVIQAQGGSPVSTGLNFYMIRSGELAARVAERELASRSHPLATLQATVHRQETFFKPGDVVRVTWPEYGLTNSPMRIMEVMPGSSQSGKMKLNLQEDIFALPPARYIQPVTTNWRDQNEPPINDIDHATGTLPAYMAAKVFGLRTVGQLEYPTVAMAYLVDRPSSDYTTYDIYGTGSSAVGWLGNRFLSTNSFPTKAQLDGGIGRSARSDIQLKNESGPLPSIGDWVFFGTGPNSEIGVIENIEDGVYTVIRGCLDTVPTGHGDSTPVTIIRNGLQNISDSVERAIGETVPYKIVPSTFIGRAEPENVPQYTQTLNDRPYRPLRPANCQVEGEGFSQVTYSGSGDISCSWSNRNRITESEIVQVWTDGNVAREAGQTTTIEVYNNTTNALLQSYTGLTGTSFDIPIGDVSGEGQIRVVFSSSNSDGLNSFRTYPIVVNGV